MKIKRVALFAVIVLGGLLLTTQIAFAHQTITVGQYAVEYGWVNEPAIVGQPNDVVINITDQSASAGSTQATNIDVSGLQIQALFGGQTKTLTLQPLGENTPGQFVAPMTPTRAGVYTIHLSGNIGTTTFNTDVQPEEIKTADLVQFPALAAATGSQSTSGAVLWIAIAGILLGAVGAVLGLLAFTRKPARG